MGHLTSGTDNPTIILLCVRLAVCNFEQYVTVPGKRALVAQIMIFLYRRF